MTEQFNTKSLPIIGAPGPLTSTPDALNNIESSGICQVENSLNNINHSSIRQIKRNLQPVKIKKETSNAPEGINRIITNDEFLAAIFEKVTGRESVLVGGFKGHLGKGVSEKWVAHPYLPKKTLFKSDENNYFTWASFTPDPNGKYLRRRTGFAALHVLVLDDIDTKAASLDQLPVPPSWILQTSPGNYQVGYIFSNPVVDGAIGELLMRAIIAAGFCDPAAGGPLTRYARLPVGVNDKHDPPYDCRLEEWHPRRQYTAEELIGGFELKHFMNAPADMGANHHGVENDEKESEIYFAPLRNNIIVTKLKEMGFYVKPSDVKGEHHLICPWWKEHTGKKNSEACYSEPDAIRRSGRFICPDGNCKSKNIYNLCKLLNVDYVDAGNWPIIRIKDGYMNEIIDSIELVIAGTGRVFQRGGEIVVIKIDCYTKMPIISKLSFSHFIILLDFLIRFERFDKRFYEWAKCNPPTAHSKLLYDSGEFKSLPILHSLNRQPSLRPDLSLMTEPGYDKEIGSYGWFDKGKFSIPNKPTQQQAKKAFEIIKGLLIGFRFKSEHDMAAACSAILAATIRSSLHFCPMFHCRAPQVSSGKSFLCRLISIFSTSVPASAVNFPSSEDECGKILLALLLSSPEVICFDNLISDLIPYKSMCSVLTEEYFTNRVLGASKTVTVPTRTLFLSSGNNVGPVRDMCRRVVTIDLDPACENPAQRSFEMDPVSTVLANREYYVSLVFTIIMGWIANGSPRSNVPPIASYGMWSDFCRQPLLWLECADPATSLFRSLEQDPDREVLGRLLHAWYGRFKNRPKMIREAISMASPELLEVFMDIAAGDRDNLNRKKLGRWISRHAGRIVDDLKFEKESGTRSSEAWRVESVSSISSVSNATAVKNATPSADPWAQRGK